METPRSKIFFSCFFLLCLVLARAQEVDDESEFSYDHESDNGPAHWGKIKPEWGMCNSGKMQSPIDLLNERVDIVSELGRLHRDYKSSNATLMNRGHDMMLRWVDGAGDLHINETSYKLKQAHWHSPSEHTINGRSFDLEVHLVHESQTGKVAVIGIMYKIGRTEPFLSVLENDLKALADTRDIERNVGIIDPEGIKIGSRKYYRYIGSLTVPPCHQDVVWTIVRKVRTVTRDQVNLIREAVDDESETNSRPVQPINKRSIKLYRPNVRVEN